MKRKIILTAALTLSASCLMAQDISLNNTNNILTNMWNGGLKTLLVTIVGIAGAIYATLGAIHFFTDSSNQEKGKKQLIGGLIGLVFATVLFFL